MTYYNTENFERDISDIIEDLSETMSLEEMSEYIDFDEEGYAHIYDVREDDYNSYERR